MSAPVPQMTVEEYAALAADGRSADVVLLDVREPDEWEGGHAPEAVHVPMNSVPAAVQYGEGPLTRDARIVVACKMGGRSAAVTAWLRGHGYDATNLDGGMLAWAQARRPLVREDGGPATVV